jgi:glucosyl-3-phosphoglycerate synthase
VGDYFQNGPITTLHDLALRPRDELDADLVRWGRSRPMSLIIPSLFSELSGDALSNIVDELALVPFLDQIIIGLDHADAAEFEHAKSFFARLPQTTRILWNDGPRLRALDKIFEDHAIAPEEPGKGRNVWYCLGYFLASGVGEVVGLHDADIVTYDRAMVSRLFYPVVHPTFGYAFAKGYYYRTDGEKLNGRVVRLLVTPLIRALRQCLGENEYLEYLDSFRYPLAGEFAMHANVVRNIRIPTDWGLEIGVLSEVHRRYTTQRICQVDLAGAYDHKHQKVSFEDPDAGLHKMSRDITKAMYRKLAIGGEVLSPEIFRTIKASYYRNALDLVERYGHVADMNGLSFDSHSEEQLVEVFAQAIMDAGDDFLSYPMESPFISSWARVQSAVPDAFDHLRAAVEADNDG